MAFSPSHRELSFMVLFAGSHETHPVQKATEMFAEAVEKRTNGELTVKVYPASTLYSQKETLEKTVRGILDMSMTTQGALDKYVRALAVVMLPFVYDSYDHAYRVLDGLFKEWVSPLLEKEKLVLLANWEWGFRNLTNNVRPVKTPDDMKGLKIRVPPEIQLRATMEASGATVIEIDPSELYTALKEGRVVGQENPLAFIYHFKLYNVQKYLSLTRHVYNSMVHMMSLKTWEKLTPDQQQIITEESKKAGDFFRKAIQDEEVDLLRKLKEQGMEIISNPDIAAFRAAMGPAYKRITEYAGEENVKRFLEIVETARR
jgi:tripartite ATP-independent transporter DctP family solute receptor